MSAQTDHDGNLALKCTFHDGGTPGFEIGYQGTCTDGNIVRNILKKKVTWCSQPENRCNQYLERGFTGARPKYCCNESRLLSDSMFNSGYYHTGERAGQGIPLTNATQGRIVLLTTRLPDEDSEAQRIVFGVTRIDGLEPNDDGGTDVTTSRDLRVLVPSDIARRLPYWRFKEGAPDWRTGLFRYLSDEEIGNYLRALFVHVHDAERRKIAVLLESVGERPPAVTEPLFEKELARIPLARKYGPGGEGPEHRKLKKYIVANPEVLGLGPGTAIEEHSFVTGDRVDVLVELANGGRVAVEVEVRGEQPTLIGAHQALKYRALAAVHGAGCADTRGVLVAYEVPGTTRAFCRRHGIEALDVQPE